MSAAEVVIIVAALLTGACLAVWRVAAARRARARRAEILRKYAPPGPSRWS